MNKEIAVKDAAIKKTLKNMHPEAVTIRKVNDIAAAWEVLESDGFEETVTTYELVGNRLMLLATLVVEI